MALSCTVSSSVSDSSRSQLAFLEPATKSNGCSLVDPLDHEDELGGHLCLLRTYAAKQVAGDIVGWSRTSKRYTCQKTSERANERPSAIKVCPTTRGSARLNWFRIKPRAARGHRGKARRRGPRRRGTTSFRVQFHLKPARTADPNRFLEEMGAEAHGRTSPRRILHVMPTRQTKSLARSRVARFPTPKSARRRRRVEGQEEDEGQEEEDHPWRQTYSATGRFKSKMVEVLVV